MSAPLNAVARVLGRLPVVRGFRTRRAERRARKAIAMPARHPERITSELPERDEVWLAALAALLWPDDEYTAIITETRREEP